MTVVMVKPVGGTVARHLGRLRSARQRRANLRIIEARDLGAGISRELRTVVTLSNGQTVTSVYLDPDPSSEKRLQQLVDDLRIKAGVKCGFEALDRFLREKWR